ncbi:hypothetical protein SS50377_23293 [Spironucleus salmonicida]|uniref:Uncharacterized protein n=1 Tax=Spironucleus salmonicida TaxID=348837 RepID=V6LU02_9EUKA|nr:hypothetical protein SS50377_23293 [Spironucleus salmonicida]|eukprot:EST47161.1 Hypothetical protein SS50377_12672 [Spironucleus salmonicida]
MHPFIQHFNNELKPATLLTTFQQCSQVIKTLNHLLQLPTLSTLELKIYHADFPGLSKITFQQLQIVYEHYSSAPLDPKASSSQLLLQAMSILQFLASLRRYLNADNEPLLISAQSFQFTSKYKELTGLGDISFEIAKLQNQLFGAIQVQEEPFSDVLSKLESIFAQLQQAATIASGKDQTLLENLNYIIKRQNAGQLLFNFVSPLGCEIQLQESELLAFSKIVQFYFTPQGMRCGTNCLAILQNIVLQLSNIVGIPVVEGTFQLILATAEQQLFSIVEVNKQQFMSYFNLMIIGRLHVYTEKEFYVQAVGACDVVVKIMQWAFPSSRDFKTFHDILQWFRHFIKPYFHDKIHNYKQVKYNNVEFYDNDLKRFIKDIDGVRDGFGFIFKTWLMCKSMFQSQRSILQGLVSLLFEIKRPNGMCIEKKVYLSIEAQDLELIGDEYDVDVILSKVGLMMVK